MQENQVVILAIEDSPGSIVERWEEATTNNTSKEQRWSSNGVVIINYGPSARQPRAASRSRYLVYYKNYCVAYVLKRLDLIYFLAIKLFGFIKSSRSATGHNLRYVARLIRL